MKYIKKNNAIITVLSFAETFYEKEIKDNISLIWRFCENQKSWLFSIQDVWVALKFFPHYPLLMPFSKLKEVKSHTVSNWLSK